MKKIVVLDGATVNPGDISWDGIAKLGELIVYERTPTDKIIERIGDAEIVLTNKTPMSAEVLYGTHIKYIGLFSTGYNIVDLDVAREKNICVCNVPSYSSNVVSQFTFALILNLCHKVQHHSNLVYEGKWSESNDFCFWDYPQMELQEKVLGIIGFGNIGVKVARIALALDMQVLVHTRTAPQVKQDDNISFVSFDDMLQQSDIISIHCPLFEETTDLINKATLSRMKKNAFVINTSRGAIVNEHDMTHALNTDMIAGYATDVVSTEPMATDNPLLQAKHCVITPHIAWVSTDTRLRLLNIVVSNLRGYLQGTPQNKV